MKLQNCRYSNEKGFTLVEILIAMALVALFMGGLLAMFAGFTKSYTTENVKVDVQQVVRGGVEHMVPHIRMAGFGPMEQAEPPVPTIDQHPQDNDGYGIGIKYAARHKIRFTADLDKNGVIDNEDDSGPATNNQERITYEYFPNENGGTLKRILYEGSTFSASKTEPIVSNVTGFSFRYFDEYGAPLPTPGTGDKDSMSDANCDLVRAVLISMTVREPAGRDGFITRTYENRVRCRNLE